MTAYRWRRPELIPTLVVLAVAALMFKLGFWQLDRLAWKEKLLADIEVAQTQAPRSLLSYSAKDLPEAQWRNITATGHFLNDKELYATPRFYREQMGFAVLTPFAVDTPSGPVYVLINRGWVPPERKLPAARPSGNPDGRVTVAGVIRSGFKHGLFQPENAPARNLWFWYDLPAMADALHLPLLPVLIDATDTTLADGAKLTEGPTPFQIEITIRNDHLGYAITWFLIGIIAVVMYVLYYLERKPADTL